MKKNDKKIILISIFLSILFFLIFVFTKNINIQEIHPPLPTIEKTLLSKEKEIKNLAFLEINNEKLTTEIKEGENIYDFMQRLKKEKKINFKDTTYPGMGKLIEEINETKNNRNKNWIYYVNGKKAEIGISNYKLNGGDLVSWKYENYY